MLRPRLHFIQLRWDKVKPRCSCRVVLWVIRDTVRRHISTSRERPRTVTSGWTQQTIWTMWMKLVDSLTYWLIDLIYWSLRGNSFSLTVHYTMQGKQQHADTHTAKTTYSKSDNNINDTTIKNTTKQQQHTERSDQQGLLFKAVIAAVVLMMVMMVRDETW